MGIKLWIVIIIVSVSVASGIVIKIRSEARKEALQGVERQNNAAGNASDDDRNSFDTCPDGLWDYGARRCQRP